ncbi:MAG: hypothetical protein ABTS22_12540 [Accumulibacter sp.]|uniref:hypothetical protein n=1 Tax=Accumulibacter sp. TaxID=2053492 RepID=UPI003315F46C
MSNWDSGGLCRFVLQRPGKALAKDVLPDFLAAVANEVEENGLGDDHPRLLA